jgi:hypothetical protein
LIAALMLRAGATCDRFVWPLKRATTIIFTFSKAQESLET